MRIISAVVAMMVMAGCGFVGGWDEVETEDVSDGEWYFHLADLAQYEYRYSMSEDVDLYVSTASTCEASEQKGTPVEMGQRSEYRLDMDEANSWPVGLSSLEVCVNMTSNDPFHVEVERRPI